MERLKNTLETATCFVCKAYPCMCQHLIKSGWVNIDSPEFEEAASEWAREQGWQEPT